MRNIENQKCIRRSSQLTPLSNCTDKFKIHFNSSQIDADVTSTMDENNSRMILNKPVIDHENQLSLLDIIENTPIIKSKSDVKNNEPTNKEITSSEMQYNDCIYLKYSKSVFTNCWSHLDDVEFKDLKAKLEKFEKCSIRRSEQDPNRYFCHECELAFDLCFDAIVKHVMVGHCNVPRMLTDELIPLAIVENGFQSQLDDSEITTRILEKRLRMPAIDGNKGKPDQGKPREVKKRNSNKNRRDISKLEIGNGYHGYSVISPAKDCSDIGGQMNDKQIKRIQQEEGEKYSGTEFDITHSIKPISDEQIDNHGNIDKSQGNERFDGVEMNSDRKGIDMINSGDEISAIRGQPIRAKHTGDSLMVFTYSKRVFRKCFKSLGAIKYQELKGKMRKYESCSIRKYGLKYNRYICNECNLVTCLNINRIMRHIIIDHCQIDGKFVDEVLIIASASDGCQVTTNARTDRQVNGNVDEEEQRIIARINEKRAKDGKDLINEALDESESSDNETECCEQPITGGETENQSLKKAPFCNKFKKGNVMKLRYSQRVFDKCFQRFDSARITEIQSILDRFTIRRNGLKKIRYFCNECNASTTSSVNKIINHVLFSHCRFPDEFRDELEVLVSLNRDMELISDREMILKINLIRSKKSSIDNQPKLIDSDDTDNDESRPINSEQQQQLADELKSISFNYCKSIFDKCFPELSEESRLEIRRKIDNINRYTMKKMREPEGNIFYQCSDCSFRHYTKAYNNFHPLKKHLLATHCAIPESIMDECILLIGNNQNFTESDEKNKTEIINRLRSKKNEISKKRPRVTIGNVEKENGIEILPIKTCRKRVAKTDNDSNSKRHKGSPTETSLLSTNRNAGNLIGQNKSPLKENLNSADLFKNNQNEIEELQFSNRADKSETNESIANGERDNRINISSMASCSVRMSETRDNSPSNHQDNQKGMSLLSGEIVSNRSIGENTSTQIHSQPRVQQVVTEFCLNYSRPLLQILCSVEGKLEFYDDLIGQLNSVLDRKFTIHMQGTDFIYGCSGCRLTTGCRQQLTQHVTSCHTDLSEDLRCIADNVIIIPINVSFEG